MINWKFPIDTSKLQDVTDVELLIIQDSPERINLALEWRDAKGEILRRDACVQYQNPPPAASETGNLG